MPASAEIQRATLDRFIAGWSNWSAAEMVETWTEDCTQVTLPFSLNHPPRTRAQVEVTLPLVQKVVTGYKVSEHITAQCQAVCGFSLPSGRQGKVPNLRSVQTLANRYRLLHMKLKIHEIVHDAARSKAVVYAVSKADTPFGDWTNEYAVFFTFDESGQHIAKVEEMVDSAFLNDFFPKFQIFLREQQQQQEGA